MNYMGVTKQDVVNSIDGLHFTLFVSGCTHKCPGCFNTQAWSFDAGNEFTEEVMKQCLNYAKDKNIRGISILGGDPAQQPEMVGILKQFKALNKPIWFWTGYTYEEMEVLHDDLLPYIDYLIDGRFEQDKCDGTCLLRGSSNQRIIDVNASRKANVVVLHPMS